LFEKQTVVILKVRSTIGTTEQFDTLLHTSNEHEQVLARLDKLEKKVDLLVEGMKILFKNNKNLEEILSLKI